jgi:hypothetical protein
VSALGAAAAATLQPLELAATEPGLFWAACFRDKATFGHLNRAATGGGRASDPEVLRSLSAMTINGEPAKEFWGGALADGVRRCAKQVGLHSLPGGVRLVTWGPYWLSSTGVLTAK